MFKKPIYPLIVALFFSLLLFLVRDLPQLNLINSTIEQVFSVPKSFMYGLKTDSSDPSQIKLLKIENERLIKKLAEYERLARDNEALRSQFESAANARFDSVPARVIGFSGDTVIPNALIIDKGKKDGVFNGAAVIIGNNLVGKIDTASINYSKVILLTNEKFATLAKTSDNNTRGVAIGNHDFLLLDRVAVTDKLNSDSIALTVGDVNDIGIGVPPDLVLGKLISVNRSASLPFQTAKLQSPVDVVDLEIVFVILGIK